MYIDRLKRKYQQILHGNSNRTELTESNCGISCKSTSKVDKKARVLTQYCENTYKSNNSTISPSYVLALKEKIAQATHNLKSKEDQCNKMRQELLRKDEQIRILESQLIQSKTSIQNNEKKVVEAMVVSAGLQKNIETLHKQLEAFAIDRELALKQAQFYKQECIKIKKQKKSVQKTINSSQKYIQEINSIRSQNSRLRQDIKRMQVVINEMCQNQKEMKLTEKHYLGKPFKQGSSWFPQNLVGEVEHFLKKQQIAQGNRHFLTNLVKFISKYSATQMKNNKKNTQNPSRVKSTAKNSHCRSVSLYDMGYSSCYGSGTSFIKKTEGMGTSALKKSLLLDKYKKYDTRKYTIESLMLPMTDEKNTTCEKILNQYKKMLSQALSEKQVQARVILGLTEEMSSAIAELIDNPQN